MATRGSDKLRKQLGARCAFDDAQLERVIGVLRKNDFKIVDWECRGQPQPDFFRGSLEVEPRNLAQATELVSLNLGERVRVELFPYGIPFPEIFRMDFESVGPGG